MMATVTITSLLPTYSAKADTAEAGICTPKPISLGDNVRDLTVDSGVATYVGGNMYVGANNMNNGGAYTNLNSTQKIDKSYAVEAEGLTLVNGKLATNGVKNSWGNKGFRFGVVGFGAQFRPKSGSDVLVVAGNSTSNTSNPTGSMQDADNKREFPLSVASIMVPLVAHSCRTPIAVHGIPPASKATPVGISMLIIIVLDPTPAAPYGTPQLLLMLQLVRTCITTTPLA